MRLGIDIGGTNIGLGLVDEEHNIIKKLEISTHRDRGYNFIKSNIIKAINNLIEYSSDLDKEVQFIGMGIPGIADKASDMIINCPNLAWDSLPLGRELKEIFGLPIVMENDANVAAIAESLLGVSKNYSNSVFMTIGTGIGGGIIVDNKLHSGSHGVGGEIGHIIVGDNFYDCNCGNNGCLETFASSTAIIKFVRHEIKNGFTDTNLIDNMEDLDTRQIFKSAGLGDRLAIIAMDRMIKYLSIGIVNIINLIDPEIIVLGGGVAQAGDFLLDKVKSQVKRQILFKYMDYADIKIAKLKNDAGIIGAAILNAYK